MGIFVQLFAFEKCVRESAEEVLEVEGLSQASLNHARADFHPPSSCEISEASTGKPNGSLRHPGAPFDNHKGPKLPFLPATDPTRSSLLSRKSSTMSAPSLAPYILKRPWLKNWMTPIANWYANAAGYRRLGTKLIYPPHPKPETVPSRSKMHETYLTLKLWFP